MEIAPMTKRDKILLYVVLMLAFVVLFVRFLLIPGIENHQQADADLREAQDAQTSMQDAIMLAGTYADTADTTAQGNAILQQILASDLIPDYDQPGYYRSVAISFCCTGEDSDFLSMLDDMAANYPSVQLVSFSIDTRSFADTDGSAVTATAFNVSLNVILCDKGGVQP